MLNRSTRGFQQAQAHTDRKSTIKSILVFPFIGFMLLLLCPFWYIYIYMLLGSLADESSSTTVVMPPCRPTVLTRIDSSQNLIVLNVNA